MASSSSSALPSQPAAFSLSAQAVVCGPAREVQRALNALMATLGTATFWLALLFVVEQTRDGKVVTLFKYRDAHQRIEEFKETARGFHGDLASKAAVARPGECA